MLKKISFILFILALVQVNAQIHNYNELGLLLTPQSQDNTARSMAMKNTFGALGGDLGAMSVNPAGLAVFNNSMVGMTLGYETKELLADFYGTQLNNTGDKFSLAQLGGVWVLENIRNNSNIRSMTFGINYHAMNQYGFDWQASGLSIPTWVEDPMDSNIAYDQLISQDYNNITQGSHSELNLGFAVNYNDTWFLGAGLNAYSVNLIEDATREELARADNGDTVDAFESFWQELDADGLSLSLGLIYKPVQYIRLGISYTTPTWYEMHESSNMFAEDDFDYVGYYNLEYSNDPVPYENNDSKVLAYDYQLKIPSKLTGSVAYVFDKAGLISADITRQNYANLNMKPEDEFNDVNIVFNEDLGTSYKISFGTEWRFDNLSIRGGYSVAQSPFLENYETGDTGFNLDNPENLIGYSLGAGYKFGHFVLDVAYDYSEKTEYFAIYPEFDNINMSKLSKNNVKVMTTLSYNF